MTEKPMSNSNFCWVIEAPGQRYLAVRKFSNRSDFHWTTDHNAAIRFLSREQADDTMMAIRQMARLGHDDLFTFESSLGSASAVEHGWLT